MLSSSSFPIPKNESERLEIIKEKNAFKPYEDHRFLREINKLAASYLNCPMSSITFVTSDQQKTITQIGMDEKNIPREESFCTYTILPEASEDVLIVLDATEDERFRSNVTVNGPLQIRFYAGAPFLIHGIKIGSVCVMDNQPHTEFNEEQQKILTEFANIVSTVLTEDDTQYIVEDHLIVPILLSMYKDLLTRINSILLLKKEKTAALSGNNGGIASSSSNKLFTLPFSTRGSSTSSKNRRSSGSSARPELQLYWNTLKQNILNYHIVIQDRFLTNFPTDSHTLTTSPVEIPNPQQHLYSFHLPSSQRDDEYVAMTKYVKQLQSSLNLTGGGLTAKELTSRVKWDYALEDEIELGQSTYKLSQLLSLILSFFLTIQLQKWKNVLINVAISDEEKLTVPPIMSSGMSSNALSTGQPSPLPTQRPSTTQRPVSAMSVNTTDNNNIGVITMHLDIRCTNRLNTSSWMIEDHQFYHELDTLFTKTWMLLQGKFHKESQHHNRIHEITHISFPIVSRGGGGNGEGGGGHGRSRLKRSYLNSSPRKSMMHVPHLKLFDSVRSFNRSSWFRSDSAFTFFSNHSTPTHRKHNNDNGTNGQSDERSRSIGAGTITGTSNLAVLNTLDESKGLGDQSISTSDRNKHHPPGIDVSDSNQTTVPSSGVLHRVWNVLSYISGSRSHQAKINP